MGGVVDAVGGLFGVGGAESVTPLQYRPYDVTSALGQATVDGRRVSAQLDPALQGIFSGLLGQAQPTTPSATALMGQTDGLQTAAQDVLGLAPQFREQASGLFGQAQQQFDIARDPGSALAYQQRVFGPELERQRLSQESRLFNQGLLGSTAGALQTEAARTAQNQALLQAAQQQQAQAFQQGQGLLGQALNLQRLGLGALGQGSQQELARQQFEAGLQQQARQQQLQALQGALGVGSAPLGLAQLGGQFGQSELQAQEGTQALRQGAEDRQASFFSSLVGAGATAFASDVRLKKNIQRVGRYTYTWEWNEKAEEIGADAYPTSGVIAQEVMKIAPEAVFRGDHGYLMVDYSKVA